MPSNSEPTETKKEPSLFGLTDSSESSPTAVVQEVCNQQNVDGGRDIQTEDGPSFLASGIPRLTGSGAPSWRLKWPKLPDPGLANPTSHPAHLT